MGLVHVTSAHISTLTLRGENSEHANKRKCQTFNYIPHFRQSPSSTLLFFFTHSFIYLFLLLLRLLLLICCSRCVCHIFSLAFFSAEKDWVGERLSFVLLINAQFPNKYSGIWFSQLSFSMAMMPTDQIEVIKIYKMFALKLKNK